MLTKKEMTLDMLEPCFVFETFSLTIMLSDKNDKAYFHSNGFQIALSIGYVLDNITFNIFVMV